MPDDDATQGDLGDQTQVGGQPVADPEANESHRWFVIGVVALLLILLAGGLAVALSDGDDDEDVATDTSTTSSSSTSTSSTTAATVPSGGGGTTPTSPPANQPTISLSTNPNFKACDPATEPNVSVTVSWSTTNATSTTLSVDGPGIFGNYGPSGSETLTPGCNTQQHTYTVKASGPNGQATKSITFNVQAIPMP